MSVAFVREESAALAAEVELPARPISPHPNLVTPSGLAALNAAMAEARAALEAAQGIGDLDERRRAAAPALRDVHYFAERLAGAQVMPPPASQACVAFGSRVAFRRGDGRRQAFTIVGEDEADPRNGTVSYVSPLARALLGKSVGDTVALGGQGIELVEIA